MPKCCKKPFVVKGISFARVFHQHRLNIAVHQICFPDSWASWSIDLKHLCLQSSFPSQYQCFAHLTKTPHVHFIKTTKNVKQKPPRSMMRKLFVFKQRQLIPYSCQSKARRAQSIELCLIFTPFFPINCYFLKARILTVWYFL